MSTVHNPASIAAPLSHYSHGVKVQPNAEWLYIAGQVGIGPDGKLAEGFEAQSDIAWTNIGAILEDAGMSWGNLVKINIYLTNPADAGASRTLRDKYLGDLAKPPAATLAIISQLANPDFVVEIEGVAAKA
jgi:2-iminobutanoate/2-iminopropanoate deaminase